jgi:hypothetical protein
VLSPNIDHEYVQMRVKWMSDADWEKRGHLNRLDDWTSTLTDINSENCNDVLKVMRVRKGRNYVLVWVKELPRSRSRGCCD